MTIIIKRVDCTDGDFLDYYLREENLSLNKELYPFNGFPAGFLAIDMDNNSVIGSSMLVDARMHSQISAACKLKNDINPWMIGLHISAKYRNQGIGKKMVDDMIKYCNDLNYSHINANTETAKDFYEKYWEISILFTYDIKNKKNEDLITNLFQIDIKKSLDLKTKTISQKKRLNKV